MVRIVYARRGNRVYDEVLTRAEERTRFFVLFYEGPNRPFVLINCSPFESAYYAYTKYISVFLDAYMQLCI